MITQPTASPTAIPPAAFHTKSQPASSRENVPVPIAIRYATSAVASLISASPSRIETSRRGTPSRRAIAVAATGSVGPTMAPSANAACQLRPIISCATTATTTIVARTSPIDSIEIVRRLARRSRRFAKNAPE